MGRSKDKAPLYFDRQLLRDAKHVLHDEETLSGFAEAVLRDSVLFRRAQQEFVRRGLAYREEAGRTGRYFTSDEVLARLDLVLKSPSDPDRKCGKD